MASQGCQAGWPQQDLLGSLGVGAAFLATTLGRMSREQVLSALTGVFPRLSSEYGVSSLALFGSVARGDARPDSDVDVLVEFRQPIGLLRFGALQAELEDLIGRRVDLVEPDALHPALRDGILAEALRAA